MDCEGVWPLAQCGSCALLSFDVALWLVHHLLWIAVALPPLGSGQGILIVSVAHRLVARANALLEYRQSAGPEQPVEVGNVGKASLQCNVGSRSSLLRSRG